MKSSNVNEGVEQKKRSASETIFVLFGLAALINLTGCMTTPNGFSQFYQDSVGGNTSRLQPYSGSTKIFTASSHPTDDVKNLFRNGYIEIGASAFTGPSQSDGALMSQAKKVGADVILVSSAYLGSQQAAVPWIQYHPGQTYTTASSGTVNANAWGSGGYAYGTGNYFGTSTTTTPGTYSTQVIPVTVHRYQYEAVFFRRGKPPILGVVAEPPSQEVRQRLERNTGVVVWVVLVGSPAFDANILDGDVILKINGDNVTSVKDYSEKLTRLAGQTIDLDIWRNGQSKTVSVKLNSEPL